MPGKTVFIFGAGASKADGLPTQAELLQRYFSTDPQDAYSETLNGYFKNFFDIADTRSLNVHWPSFEEALAMVEIALDKEQSFGPVYIAEKLKKVRDGLIISMGRAIENCNVGDSTIHKKFVRKLFHKGHFSDQEYSFVSFNYDILLDKALMDLIDHEIYCDYSIDFANARKNFIPLSFEKWNPPGERSVLLLKPHGSLNWMQCASCDAISISGRAKGQIFKTGLIHTIEQCPNDQSPMQFVVEPPSYFKKYKNYYLQCVWLKLNEILSASTKIVFIGYSMPDADVMIKYAIKRACFRQSKNIVVVNPDETVKERYERVLGKVSFHKMSFGELLKSENYIKVIKS